MEDQTVVIEKIKTMAMVLTAMKDCFVQKRETKDEIITIATETLLGELKKLQTA